ncbi:MAG: IPT/TIG domain-containing protein, partial [Candidatus Symbiothrix sp.]|nr:IPT/TIG domain-containing protein [Candidatus Symbiothrix sp.]
MKQTCLVNAKEDEKGIAGQARNDRPFRMKQNKLIRLNAGCRTLFAACVCVCFCMYFSCNDSENSGHGTPYDPNKPVVIETFSPDSGGMATKLFITGHNFGNDPAAIKVYYNDKLAPVVGADGEHIYAITPRQPGEL